MPLAHPTDLLDKEATGYSEPVGGGEFGE